MIPLSHADLESRKFSDDIEWTLEKNILIALLNSLEMLR